MSQESTPATAALQQPGVTKVFIQRDYSEGTCVKFHTRLPTELEGLIERHVFEATMTKLNEFYAKAEEGSWKTYGEGCLACISVYLVYLIIKPHYDVQLRKIAKFLAAENERAYNPKGVHIVDPSQRGLRVVEITIFDRPGRT